MNDSKSTDRLQHSGLECTSAAVGPPNSFPQPKDNFSEPDLPFFRSLQYWAIAFAALWICIALWGSDILIQELVQRELDEQQARADSQATFIAQLIDKDLYSSEQLAIAVANESDILKLLADVNSKAESLHRMTVMERKDYLEQNHSSEKVNKLFDTLSANVNLMSIFLLDADGNCVASSRLHQSGKIFEAGCVGSNYRDRFYFGQAKLEGLGRQFAVGKRVPLPSLFVASESIIDNIFVGATVVRINVGALTENLKDMPSVTWVTDQSGVVISSTWDDVLFQHVGVQYYPYPRFEELRRTYARDSLVAMSLNRVLEDVFSRDLFEISNSPYLFSRAPVTGRDFEVWHGLDVTDIFNLKMQAWYFTVLLLFLGLLLILIVERVLDFHQRRLGSLMALSRANRSLKQVSDQLYSIAITDHLTQLSSRGYFLQRLEEEVVRAHRETRPLSILLLDIDRFKRINDTFGHPVGDKAIRQLADICKDSVRGADLVGRMGGEEFAVVLIDCNVKQAVLTAETIRQKCEEALLTDGNEVIRFTCSIGIAELAQDQSSQNLLVSVDKALYCAKESGRNCIKLVGDARV